MFVNVMSDGCKLRGKARQITLWFLARCVDPASSQPSNSLEASVRREETLRYIERDEPPIQKLRHSVTGTNPGSKKTLADLRHSVDEAMPTKHSSILYLPRWSEGGLLSPFLGAISSINELREYDYKHTACCDSAVGSKN